MHGLKKVTKSGVFATWLAEIFQTHPHLTKRVKALHDLGKKNTLK